MATNSNGNGRSGAISFGVVLSPMQFWMTLAALVALLSGIGVRYNTLCTRVDAAFVEMDKRTAARDAQYCELREAVSDLTTTVQDIREGLLVAGIIKPNAMRPMGHPANERP